MKFNLHNEFDTLKVAIVASVDNFAHHEVINNTQSFFYKNNPPILEVMQKEQQSFWNALKSNGVELIIAKSIQECPQQIFTRDIAFAIHDTLFVSNMKKALRQNERKGINEVIDSNSKCVFLKHHVEGGDIIVNGNDVYVGISQRTEESCIDELKSYLSSSINFYPIFLNESFLHLDTVFNVLANGVAITCKEAISVKSESILKRFDCINIDLQEQFALNTNIISINPKTLVVQPHNKKINHELTSRGFNLIQIDYAEITKMGGSFRCSICPLVRE